METVIAIVIVVLAAAGVIWSLYRTTTGKGGCGGCGGCGDEEPTCNANQKQDG